MTLGKLTAACWIVFGVMCGAFLPLILVLIKIPVLPEGPRMAIAVIIVLVLWWGPFVYGMYLAQAGMGNGDRRLLKRGVHGTAVVLKAQPTSTYIGGGGSSYMGGHRVYRYHLRVSLPGKAPFETYCSIASSGIHEGETVQVAAGRYNRKRVTIDVGQGQTRGYAPAYVAPRQSKRDPRRPPRKTKGHAPHDVTPAPIEDDIPPEYRQDHGFQSHRPQPGSAGNATRIRLLAELGKLHSQGVLTDAEFAAEKARILNQ